MKVVSLGNAIRTVAMVLAAALLFPPAALSAELLSGAGLLKSLQQGGKVILMRHASSPRTTPDRSAAAAGNTGLERQLDEVGRSSATAMGKALRELKIPIGEVLTSPTFRALETLHYAGFTTFKTYDELGEGGAGMQPSSEAQANWLRLQVQQFPTGTNKLIVTHFPNVRAAYPDFSADLADGEALVLGKGDKGAVTLLARVKISDWAGLAKQ